MVDTIKFSQMTDGGDIDNNKKVPGLKAGANVLFNNPWTFLPPGTTAERPTPAADMYYRLRFNTEEQLYEYYDIVLGAWTQLQESLFTQGPFVIYTADASIPDGQNLGALANGILKQTISAGIATLDIAVNEVDYYGPGMTGYLQAPAGVRDVNSNVMLTFQPVASAVNAIAIQNAATATDPGFNAIGTNTNIGLGYAAKGTGLHKFYSTSTTPFQIQNGTGYQRVNQFLFADVAGSFVYTFPQASGTISLVGSTADSVQGTANQVLVNGTSGTPETGALILTLPQDIATTSSPTFNNLRLNGGGISDVNGNEILHFSGTPMAVNFFALSNVATGNIPVFAADGADTNVSFGLNTKGTGVFNYKSAALTNQVVLNLGSTYSSIINHNYPSNTNTRTYTWQDASGTVAFLSDVPAVTPAALTRTDDTNVTLTLGGTPATALLQATSLTLGWTGQLALTRGGSNASLTASNGGIVYSSATAMAILAGTATANLPLLSGSSAAPTWGSFALNLGGALTTAGALTTVGAFAVTHTYTGVTGVTFPTSGTLATTSQIPTGAALSKTDDTNVTLTLGGSPTTALINATSLTLGWTGQLGLTRGGSNASLTASNGGIVYSTASAMAILAGTATAGQMLRSGASGAPSWSTATYPATAGTTGNFLKSDGTNWSSQPVSSIFTAPTQQRFTSGSGTYTLPSPTPLYLRVRMVAGGGGGAGSGTATGTAAGAGGISTFGTSLLSCVGGGAGVFGLTGGAGGGAGGAPTITAPAFGTGVAGGSGGGNAFKTVGTNNFGGAMGGASFFGGAGGGGQNQTAGNAAAANSGSGGGGAGDPNASATSVPGTGGGAGAFIDAIITSPGASYAYAVGAAGTAGAAGTGGLAGGAGGSGYIEVTEYYQ